MKIRIVDYQGNLGGGLRFATEMVNAFISLGKDIHFDLVSHGEALETYHNLFHSLEINAGFIDIRPVDYWKNYPKKIFSIPGSARMSRLFGFGKQWYFEVPEEAFADCDLVWFPWVHRHRIPVKKNYRVVGTYHDAIFFQFDGLIKRAYLEEERKTINGWLTSSAEIVVSSHNTVSVMNQLFGCSNRLKIIPVSGEHSKPQLQYELPASWEWTKKPFLIYPANTFPHKNHETLLKGYAGWGAKIPLVLTGEGTDFPGRFRSRGSDLRKLIKSLKLQLGQDIIPLGYISNEIYNTLLSRAWGLIMPSLAEGGGSFPVYEAMIAGIPVICSDIPVMREQMKRTNGQVSWFSPYDVLDLSKKLMELENNYLEYQSIARNQIKMLQQRTWQDVATEYFKIFETVCKKLQSC